MNYIREGLNNPLLLFCRDSYIPYYEKTKGMIYMCKVYEFPVKKELPKELEERLDEVTKSFVNIMTDILDTLCDGEPTEEDYNELMEMMVVAYIKSLEKAIDELE